MPSNLLKSSPVDTSPPVVILPPNIVEIEVDGVKEQLDIYCELAIIPQEDTDGVDAGSGHLQEAKYLDQDLKTPGTTPQPDVSSPSGSATKTGRRGKLVNRSLKRLQNRQQQDGSKNGDPPKTPSSRKSLKQQAREEKKLPEALVKVLDNYVLEEAPHRPNNAYIRYIERTPEELAEIVEYDVDEEDYAWLKLVNEERTKESLPEIPLNWMEEIMDKLEKESFYMSSGMDQGSLIDDDAVCCICMDGECQNANAILFCDMCNLAVHQECYGVPYIPEGQWLCRRCFFSPSRPVECVLCPNTGGAFKQTECKRWAHVVCAIWIPEVCFANTVFLEPIDNINTIPPARWRLTCFICKQKNRGACIQCIKSNCYTAFHVTCAQLAGWCMRMDPDSERGVKKKAYCTAHAPADFIADRDRDSSTEHQRLKHVRKMLAEKRCAAPVVLIPTIAPEKIAQISSIFNFRRKDSFMSKIMAYWKLKRSSRNGVPLLRRLQITNTSSSVCKSSRKGEAPEAERSQQNYADTLRVRQDLEKGRLLCELTRKREKTKREQIYTKCQEWDMRIQPFNYFLSSIIDDLVTKDTQCIFTQPVDPELVPDYLSVITNPMDLSAMKKKIFEFEYETIEDLQADFELMIRNCMQYNSKDTLFYRAASRMQEMGGIVFREAKRQYDLVGFKPGGVMSESAPPQYYTQPEIVNDADLAAEIEQVLEDKGRHDLSFEEHLRVLHDIFDKSLTLSNLNSRKKKFIRIKKEIYRLKKKQRQEIEGDEGSVSGARDVSSMDEDETAPSLFGGDTTVESSDVGEDEGESGASRSNSTARYSNIRRRLRSTDHNELLQQQQQQQQKTPNPSRISRRLSRSSESVAGTSTLVSPPMSLSTSLNARPTHHLSSSAQGSRPRGRGRPPKFVSQSPRGRGRGVTNLRTGSGGRSISSPRQSTAVLSSPSSMRRGSFRGRPPKGRRNLRRSLRRSARVDHLQKQALLQQGSNSSPEKEQSESSRHASPGGRSASPAKSSRSSRHVSPILGSSLKPQQGKTINVQNSSVKISPALGSPARSTQVSRRRPPAPPSPILGSPLKPHQMYMVREALNRRMALNERSTATDPKTTTVNQETSHPTTSSDSKRPRGRGRPPRNSVVKVVNNNNNNSAASGKADSGSPKSMEAAAKSIVCEDRLSPRAARQQQLNRSAHKPARRRILVDAEEDEDVDASLSPNRLGGAGAISPVVRRNSVARGSALLQNLNAARNSSPGNTSPARRLKGPAGAVGRRRKSTNSDPNGPLINASLSVRTETVVTDKRKSPPLGGGQPLNGLSSAAISPVRHQVASLQNHPTSAKKRPRRSAAVIAAKSIHGVNSNTSHHNNNSLVSGSGNNSLHHHHHHHPHHSPRKMDSFSVYRSGGDHDINSYSEAESINEDDDEVEEEEEDDDEEDEDEDEEEEEDDDDEDEEEEEEGGKTEGKPISASEDDDDEEEDEDEEEDDDEEDEEDRIRNRAAPKGQQEEESDNEDDDDDEGASGDKEEPDDDEENEEDETEEQDDDFEDGNEQSEEQHDYAAKASSRQQETSGSDNSSDSDDSDSSCTSSSTISSTSAASTRSKASSSSSVTNPRHFHASAKRMKVVRRRRSPNRQQQRPQPAILGKLSSSTSHFPSQKRPIPIRPSPLNVSQVTHNNNNNVVYTNKEKDRSRGDGSLGRSSSGANSAGRPVPPVPEDPVQAVVAATINGMLREDSPQ